LGGLDLTDSNLLSARLGGGAFFPLQPITAIESNINEMIGFFIFWLPFLVVQISPMVINQATIYLLTGGLRNFSTAQ
jgi:hypothetical protein